MLSQFRNDRNPQAADFLGMLEIEDQGVFNVNETTDGSWHVIFCAWNFGGAERWPELAVLKSPVLVRGFCAKWHNYLSSYSTKHVTIMSPMQWRGPATFLFAWAVFMTLYFSWWSTNTSPNLPNNGLDRLASTEQCPSCICPPQSQQASVSCPTPNPTPPTQSCPPQIEKIVNVCPPTTPGSGMSEQKKETCILNESINLEPPKPGYLTGPRESPIKKRAKRFDIQILLSFRKIEYNLNLFDFFSLVTIPVGAVSKQNVNKIIQKFGFENFQFMLFHYDEADWSDQDWYWDVISIRYVYIQS